MRPVPLLEERGLGEQQGGTRRVLVANRGGGQDAVALLGGDHEIGRRAANVAVLAGRFELRDDIRVVLEADEEIVDHLSPEVPADARDLARGHFRGDDDRRWRQRTGAGQLAQLEVREQGGDFVAGDEAVVALAVGRRAGQAADAVRVRVGGDDQVGGVLAGRRPRPGPCTRALPGSASWSHSGNWPSGVACSGTGIGRNPWASSTSPAQKPPQPWSGV